MSTISPVMNRVVRYWHTALIDKTRSVTIYLDDVEEAGQMGKQTRKEREQRQSTIREGCDVLDVWSDTAVVQQDVNKHFENIIMYT